MKIVFERDEIVSILSVTRKYTGLCSAVELKLENRYADLFIALSGTVFNVELNYDENSVITGGFIWSANDGEHVYLESTGPVNYVYLNKEDNKKDNSKALRRISKIQNQLDKLKVEI